MHGELLDDRLITDYHVTIGYRKTEFHIPNIKAGAANMAGAWLTLRPVWLVHWCSWCVVYMDRNRTRRLSYLHLLAMRIRDRLVAITQLQCQKYFTFTFIQQPNKLCNVYSDFPFHKFYSPLALAVITHKQLCN